MIRPRPSVTTPLSTGPTSFERDNLKTSSTKQELQVFAILVGREISMSLTARTSLQLHAY